MISGLRATRPFGCSTKWGYKREGVDEATTAWNKQEVKLDEADLANIELLADNDTYILRMICVWSLKDKSSVKNFDKLILLRRIYQYSPFELITINCDPIKKKKKVLKFLKKHHASIPKPSAEVRKRRPGNYILSSGTKEELFKSLGQTQVKSAPLSMIIVPEGEILMLQTNKLDVHSIRVNLSQLLSRRR